MPRKKPKAVGRNALVQPSEASSSIPAGQSSPIPAATSASSPPVRVAPRFPAAAGLPPPLPDPVPLAAAGRADLDPRNDATIAAQTGTEPATRLREGCYLLRYTPTQSDPHPIHYDGTLRVERADGLTRASGDLYLHQTETRSPMPARDDTPAPGPEPVPGQGIPILPREAYRYYLRVTQVRPCTTGEECVELQLSLHRFSAATSSWALESVLTTRMKWEGNASDSSCLSGGLQNESGIAAGSLTLCWVSPSLRRATVEIGRVSDSEAPMDNGDGISWQMILKTVGWEVSVEETDHDIQSPAGEAWSDAELHATMLARRRTADLDSEWRYYVLCVHRLESATRGIMFDSGATDSNHVPREGAAIASHWVVPDEEVWGLIRNMRFGLATPAYFRTAVHEIGHAMGLYHTTTDLGIMNTTDVIAARAEPPVQFPNNIVWAYAAEDQKRLRHMPDIWVRPGGVPFGTSYATAPLNADDRVERAEGLSLRVWPLLESVPLGAPVRINFALANPSRQAHPAPGSLSLKTGFVRGQVVDPTGTVRAFLPLVRCVDAQNVIEFAPGAEAQHAMTLLRGPQGSLFPIAGPYRVIVQMTWDWAGIRVGLSGETSLMVTGARGKSQAEAALTILSSADALLTLALGGDHLPEGISAIHAGLDNPVLRPHYAVIEAKRVGQPFMRRPPDYARAAQLIDEKTVMSAAEIKRAAALARSAEQNAAARFAQDIAATLRKKVRQLDVSDDVVKIVWSL